MMLVELSDFEINMLVAKHLHPTVKLIKSNSRPNCVVALDVLAEGCNVWLDYCNNIQDSWPLIVQNRIEISWEGPIAIAKITSGYLGKNPTVYRMVVDKNPLKAAMCVFLAMKDKEVV